MITLGASLFVGSGNVIRSTGPAAIMLPALSITRRKGHLSAGKLTVHRLEITISGTSPVNGTLSPSTPYSDPHRR
ncbi:hypothetical protein D3I60_16955 [Brevibacterium permense]|nr:hypothetical protein [Brevibacterium permense]